MLRLVAEGVVEGAGFGVAAVSMLCPDGMFEVAAVAGSDEARELISGDRWPLADLEASFAVAEKWGLLRFVSDERLDTLIGGWVPDLEPVAGPDAWLPQDALRAPLLSATGELLGVLSVDLPHDGRRPGQEQRDLLEMYAVTAGIALDNSRQRSQLREQVRLSDAVRTVNQTATRLLALGHVIDSSLPSIVAGLRCHAAWLRVFDGQGEFPGRGRGAFHPPSATLAPPDEIVAMARRLAILCWMGHRIAVIAAGSPPPEGLSDADAATALAFIGRAGSQSVAVVPIGAGADCLGYMVLTRQREEDVWTEHEREAAREIGRDLGRGVLHARLYEREQRSVADLAALDAYKSELLATVSHELKNPLSAVLGYVELLDDQAVPGQGDAFRSINRNIERMTRLVDDLLLLSRLANPDQPMPREPVDLDALARDVVDDMTIHASLRRVDLQRTASSGPVFVDGNPDDLERALLNLVGNAIKYSPPGARVDVTVHGGGATGLVEVRDQGLGISVADQASLFGEFFRSTNPVARAEPGTGLGLSIVKRIAERHRGRIDVASELGAGSTFTLAIPLTTT